MVRASVCILSSHLSGIVLVSGVCLETADSDGRCKRAGRAGRAGLTVNTPLALTAGELSSQLSQYTGRRDLQSREGGGHSTPVMSNSPLREKYIMKTIMLS